MPQVPIAAFKDNVARYVAQAHAGEEIVVTRHGKPMARLIAPFEGVSEEQRALADELVAFRRRRLATSGPISGDDIDLWIAQGRAEWDDELLSVILDASAVGRLLLPDEGGEVAMLAVGAMRSERLVGPAHYAAELTNLVRKAYRFSRIDRDERDEALRRADRLLARTSIDTGASPIRVNDVAERHRLSTYDAFYLELALRTALPIVTADGVLGDAADAAGLRYR